MSLDRSITVDWEDPSELAEQAFPMRGLDFLRALRDEELPPPPIQRLLGFRLAEVDEGRAVYVGMPGEQHFSAIGVVHNSFALALLDSAMAAAVHSTLGSDEGYTTLEAKLSVIRPVFEDSGELTAEGSLVHRGRQMATAAARLEDSGGRLFAHASTTCLIRGG